MATPKTVIDWVHPSVRDAVIDYMIDHPRERLRFLQTASVQGCLLAFSSAGGATGERQLPFLREDADWDALTERVGALIEALEDSDVIALLRGFESIWRSESLRPETVGKLRALTERMLESLQVRWNRAQAAISSIALRLYYSTAEAAGVFAGTPELDVTWRSIIALGVVIDDVDSSLEILRLLKILESNEPRFLRVRRYSELMGTAIGRLAVRIVERLSAMRHLDPEETAMRWATDEHGGDYEVEVPVEPDDDEHDEREWLDEHTPLIHVIESLKIWSDLELPSVRGNAAERLTEREERLSRYDEGRHEGANEHSGESAGSRSGDQFDFDDFFSDL